MFISRTIVACGFMLTGLLTLTLGCDSDEKADNSQAQEPVAGFNGTFHATVDGDASVMTLQQNGQKLTGTLEDASITGEVNGNSAQGSLKDSISGEALPLRFTFTLDGDKITAVLTARNPKTGEDITIPNLIYTREGAVTAATAAKVEPQPAKPVPKGDDEHDPALVGAWRYTYTAASGGASVAVDDWLYIEADGTIREGDSHAAGGNADVGIEASGSGGGFVAKWRSSERHLQIKQEKTGEWVPLARYYVEGDKMLLTYNNGSKKIWYRQ